MIGIDFSNGSLMGCTVKRHTLKRAHPKGGTLEKRQTYEKGTLIKILLNIAHKGYTHEKLRVCPLIW